MLIATSLQILVTLAAVIPSQTAPDASAPKAWLIVGDRDWKSVQDFNLLASQAGMPDFAKNLEQAGYHAVSEGGRVSFAFSQSLWQEDSMSRRLAAARAIADCIGDGGYLKSGSPEARRFVVVAFAAHSTAIGLSTSVRASVLWHLSLAVADRRVDVDVFGPDPSRGWGAHGSALEANPDPVPVQSYAVSRTDSYYFTTIDPNNSVPVAKLKPAEEDAARPKAVGELEDHYNDFFKSLTEVRSGIAKRLSPWDLGRVQGQVVTQLPAPVRQQIEAALRSKAEQLGFASGEDGLAFFSTAAVSAAVPILRLSARRTGVAGSQPVFVTVDGP